MDVLQSLSSKSFLVRASPSTPLHVPVCLLRFRQSVKIRCADSSNSGSDETPPRVVPPITPPDTVEIRFKRGSKKRRQLREDGFGEGQPLRAQASQPTPKKWEEMSVAEKAMELYMGEKGLLFWLNKFAYASIFIMIGAWIFFRFVGPAINLYQLDSPPLSPSSVFKGS
ncbi:hypothetical protein SLE2022_360020 [Rubroshorea leprosula]